MTRPRARHRLLGTALLVLLAGCGGSSSPGGGSGSRDELVGVLGGGADEARQLPDELQGVDWQLVAVTESGATRDVAEVDGTLRFDGDTVSGRACNSYGARVEKVTAEEIRTAGFESTQMGCDDVRGELDELAQRVLLAGAAWSLDDDVLVLRNGDLALTYRPRDAAFPSRTATPLVQGEIGSAQYQLAWEASDEHVGVDWSARERPGTGFSSTGIGRSVRYEVTHLEPSSGRVADRAFVFVPTTLETARAVFEPAGGGDAVALTEHRIPPAKTWKLFAGFVGDRSEGGVVVTYDQAGRELMRSYPLPT